jgi:DNA-binding transcriptional LysR family regulator
MELRHLRYFIAVAEAEGFGRAAQHLHVAQPALSRQIRDLEAEMDVRLFQRLARGVRLTAAGTVFLQDAKRMIAELTKAAERARLTAFGQIGEITIGFNESVSWNPILPRCVRAFRVAHPQVRLHMVPMSSVDQLRALHERQIDGGFLFYRARWDRELNGIPVIRDPVVLAVAHSSPLASRRVLRLADLTNEVFYWFPRPMSPAYHDEVMDAFLRAGVEPQLSEEGTTETALLGLVSTGTGFTFAPASARWRKPEGVALIPVRDLRVTVTLEFVWRVGNPSPATQQMIECVREVVRSAREDAARKQQVS